jgi:hypothetical protein
VVVTGHSPSQWDCEGVIVRDVMRTASIVNTDAYFSTLKKTRNCCQRVRPDGNLQELLLQHGNARPHTGVRTREAVTQFGWTVLPLPPRSAGLGPSDFDLGPLNDAVHGGKSESDVDVVSAVKTCVKTTRDGTGRAYMTSFHAGANCMDNSRKIRISKLRFSQHFVIFKTLE